MADLNKVILMGHMTADPELKQTTSGISVCSFSIGVNRRYYAVVQKYSYRAILDALKYAGVKIARRAKLKSYSLFLYYRKKLSILYRANSVSSTARGLTRVERKRNIPRTRVFEYISKSIVREKCLGSRKVECANALAQEFLC